MSTRRSFISFLGGAGVVWPLAAGGQQAAMPKVGYLGAGAADATPHLIAAFIQGLENTGFVPDRNVAIVYRWAEGDYGRLPSLAAELVQLRVDVMVTFAGFPTAHAAKAATTTIPIVFMIGGDPVAGGLVSSLSRPGGNITGVTSIATEIGSKRLELLHELTPSVDVVAILVNPNNRTAAASTRDSILRSAANVLGLQLRYVNANTVSEIEDTFADISKQRVAVYVTPDPFYISQARRLAELSNRYAIPTCAEMSEFPRSGGLMSYGMNLREQSRLVGICVGKVLKGAQPADLPVERATTLELVLNVKAAKRFGLTVPDKLIAVADEVIE